MDLSLRPGTTSPFTRRSLSVRWVDDFLLLLSFGAGVRAAFLAGIFAVILCCGFGAALAGGFCDCFGAGAVAEVFFAGLSAAFGAVRPPSRFAADAAACERGVARCWVRGVSSS